MMSTVTTPPATERLTLTPSESVVIRSATVDSILVEAAYGAGGEPPPRHFHPSQDERFRVLAGELRVAVDGVERDLAEGDEIDIPRGAVHQMWNPHSAPARVEWRTSPGGRTEAWFRAVDALHRSGRVGDDGMPSPIAFAVLLREYDDVIRLAGPQPLLRPALGLLALVGRARGYSA
jgi:quercetin dioxygenase-like cupin family protein